MKILFAGLTLLLASFLSTLEHLDALRDLVGRAGAYRWLPELLLAAAAVALFLGASKLHRRLLFPRRGMRLLAAGVAVYAVGAATASGAVVHAAGWLPIEQGSVWADVSGAASFVDAPAVFVIAQLLLIVGAIRAFSNLVPPSEFEADF